MSSNLEGPQMYSLTGLTVVSSNLEGPQMYSLTGFTVWDILAWEETG